MKKTKNCSLEITVVIISKTTNEICLKNGEMVLKLVFNGVLFVTRIWVNLLILAFLSMSMENKLLSLN